MARNQLEPGGRLRETRCGGQSRSTLFSLSASLFLFLLGMSCAPKCEGYSVLTHEAIIDAASPSWSVLPGMASEFAMHTAASARWLGELAFEIQVLKRRFHAVFAMIANP